MYSLRWAPLAAGDPFRVELHHYAHVEDQVAALRRLLRVLPHVRLSDDFNWSRGSTVAMVQWEMTHKIMRVLQKLPHLTGVLDLSQCTFPLPASKYAELARCIPTSYTEWRLGEACRFSHMHSICMGLEWHWKRHGLPPLKLVWAGHTGDEEAVGKHVILTH